MDPEESTPLPTLTLDDLNWEIRTHGTDKPVYFTTDDGLFIAIDALFHHRGPHSLELIHHPREDQPERDTGVSDG